MTEVMFTESKVGGHLEITGRVTAFGRKFSMVMVMPEFESSSRCIGREWLISFTKNDIQRDLLALIERERSKVVNRTYTGGIL